MSQIRPTIDESWAVFQELLDSVPDDRLEEAGACGAWSVKDVMAHVAFWDDRAVFVARTLAAGAQLPPFDWQEANDREAERRADWSVDDSRAALLAAHERLLHAVERYPEIETDIWRENTFEHYEEHTVDLRNWLDGQR